MMEPLRLGFTNKHKLFSLKAALWRGFWNNNFLWVYLLEKKTLGPYVIQDSAQSFVSGEILYTESREEEVVLTASEVGHYI